MAKRTPPKPPAKPPERKFIFRSGVGATVWLNEAQGDDGEISTYRSVSISPRRFRDKDGNWRDGSFRVDDLPLLELALRQAYAYCQNAYLAERQRQDGEAPPMAEPVDDGVPF